MKEAGRKDRRKNDRRKNNEDYNYEEIVWGYDFIESNIEVLDSINNLNNYEKNIMYFILNLCAKFSLKSQPSIYGKYGKWIL